jgi:FtsP/CotA-like multicopper oxidase with cupredoxin domain
MRHFPLLFLLAAPAAAAAQTPAPDPIRIETAAANPNTTPAGSANGNVVTLRMVARAVRWHPEAEDGPSIQVEAFGEEGALASIPGPLIRVPVGTVLDVSIRNVLPDTLLVFGLATDEAAADTLRIAPGETKRTRATRSVAGTYAYGGATVTQDSLYLLGAGNQLLGALIVDAPGTRADRVFVMSIWPPTPGAFVMAINGKSWPHTERMDVTVGDSVKWRVINGTRGRHPMHLHGFYFRIDSRGSWFADTAITAEHPHVVTESIPLRGTYTMTWSPERAGNWLFHCHDALHTTWRRRYNLIGERPPAVMPMNHDVGHMEQDMSGLVIGIRARNPDGGMATPAPPAAQEHLRVLVHEKPRHYGSEPGFSYIVPAGAAPAPDSIEIPAKPLILARGVPTAITVVNRLPIATAVHWHGMELDSYNDGVAGWSGDSVTRARAIAPADSFIARMTPPRAGTFIFHAHVDDMRQMALGLYGPLIVLPPGERWNPERDHIFLLSQMGRGQLARTGLNGSTAPPPMTVMAGVPHRFRFINISVEDDAQFTLLRDTSVVSWRALAKDGADLATAHAVTGRGTVLTAPGETYDYEVVFEPGVYTLQVDTRDDVSVAIHAVAAPAASPAARAQREVLFDEDLAGHPRGCGSGDVAESAGVPGRGKRDLRAGDRAFTNRSQGRFTVTSRFPASRRVVSSPRAVYE